MTTDGILFKKLLGAKALIKDSIVLNQNLGHYIAYDFDSGVFEVTIFSQSIAVTAPYWVFKLEITGDKLEKLMKVFKHMIQHWEIMIPEEERSNEQPTKINIIPGAAAKSSVVYRKP